MNARPYKTKDYEKRAAFGGRENKANQSQFVFLAAENAEVAE